MLQSSLTQQVRGRVMSLWIMGFGGTVPFGLLAFGWVADHTSVTTVLLIGSGVALLLGPLLRITDPPPLTDG